MVQVRYMAHSICLIKLYQTTMTNFEFLFLTTLRLMTISEKSWLAGPEIFMVLFSHEKEEDSLKK